MEKEPGMWEESFGEKSMPSWRPSGSLVCKTLTLGENSPTQDSVMLKPSKLLLPSTQEPYQLYSQASWFSYSSLSFKPSIGCSFLQSVHNWKERQFHFAAPPQAFSCETNHLPLAVKEVGMAEAWVRKWPPKPQLISLFFQTDFLLLFRDTSYVLENTHNILSFLPLFLL